MQQESSKQLEKIVDFFFFLTQISIWTSPFKALCWNEIQDEYVFYC